MRCLFMVMLLEKTLISQYGDIVASHIVVTNSGNRGSGNDIILMLQIQLMTELAYNDLYSMTHKHKQISVLLMNIPLMSADCLPTDKNEAFLSVSQFVCCWFFFYLDEVG